MTSIDKVYQELTGVNINEQKLLWDERGKGYFGEYLVFKELYSHLNGCCKILMNVNIPTKSGKTTEIDLLLIHETGLYVFEVKHFKGNIYGKSSDQKWTQYFRTSPNSHFYNPVLQNQYHIEALRNKCPNIPIYSFIIFTSPECTLHVKCIESDITVCQLRNLHSCLHILGSRNTILNIQSIDELFCELSVFSPMTNTLVSVDGDTVPLNQYLNTILEDFSNEKENLNNTFNTFKKAERKKTHIVITVSVLVCFAVFALCAFSSLLYGMYAKAQINAAEQSLDEFAQKFERVEDFNNGEIVLAQEIVTSSNIHLEESHDLENAVSFSCSLNWNGLDYGISIGKDAVLIAILNDGSIKECPIYNSTYPYSSDYRLGKSNRGWYSVHSSGDIPCHNFYNISIDEISYIKLSNVDVWIDVNNHPKIISSGQEIELYQAG